MSDYDEISEEETRMSEECEEEEEDDYDDYYYRRKRGYWDYDDYECKKCKTDNSYEFVTINPVIFTSVLKLQDMASVSVAATLWNHVNIPRAISGVNDRCTKKSTEWSALCNKVLSLTGQLPIPNPIAEIISKCARKMAGEITNWVSYHYRSVFFGNGLDKFVYSLVYHIVWYPNGTINCEQTARSMITSLRLSEVEKLKFFCTYCLQDEIEEMSPLLYLDNVLDYVSIRSYPMIYYWYCYFRDELHKIRKTGNTNANLSDDVYMLQHVHVDNWSAKEYFFDLLSSDEQVRQAIWLIDKHGVLYQKAVLMKLNETQRLHVYMERAVEIIMNYARPRVSSKFILLTWSEVRNLISRDRFLTLFREMLKEGIKDTILTDIWSSASDDLKYYAVNFNSHEIVAKILLQWKWCNESDFVYVLLSDSSTDIKESITTQGFFVNYCEILIKTCEFQKLDRLLEFCLPVAQKWTSFISRDRFLTLFREMLKEGIKDTILTDIWTSASDDLKYYAVNFNSHEIVAKILLQWEWCYESDFVYVLLSDSSTDTKESITTKGFFVNYCEILIETGDFQKLDRLLEFCLPYAPKWISFKLNLVMNSKHVKDTCLKFYPSGNSNGLNEYLNQHLASSPDLIVEYKKKLIKSSDGIEKCISVMDSETDVSSVIIEDSLSDAHSVMSFKKQIIFSSSAISKLKNLLMTNRLNVVQSCMDRYLTSVEEKKSLKKVLSGDVMQMTRVLLRNYDESYLQTVMLWIFGSENDVQQFKRSLHLDSIFVSMLKDCVYDRYDHLLTKCDLKYCRSSDFEAVSRLLNWYFESPTKAKEYKIKMIHSYRRIEVFTPLLRGCRGDLQLKTMIQWFFQNDAAEIAKFKSMNHGKICSMI